MLIKKGKKKEKRLLILTSLVVAIRTYSRITYIVIFNETTIELNHKIPT